ncbi:hypothetical protein [Clostridium tarantellae]|uniref:Uncharacterized protein n=1 Tax=Clostridium tarantellae TaxID=39493 RepID=A0A6I1MQ76_9CLOT|nr:hypothetical protein [Clostridium tarantellae]MPQ44973.1 hypothetical protein [Clostridium tarantellae]
MKEYDLLNKKEYEKVGENEFPLKYLTKEEILELGLTKNKCCQNNKSCCKTSLGCCKSRRDIK